MDKFDYYLNYENGTRTSPGHRKFYKQSRIILTGDIYPDYMDVVRGFLNPSKLIEFLEFFAGPQNVKWLPYFIVSSTIIFIVSSSIFITVLGRTIKELFSGFKKIITLNLRLYLGILRWFYFSFIKTDKEKMKNAFKFKSKDKAILEETLLEEKKDKHSSIIHNLLIITIFVSFVGLLISVIYFSISVFSTAILRKDCYDGPGGQYADLTPRSLKEKCSSEVFQYIPKWERERRERAAAEEREQERDRSSEDSDSTVEPCQDRIEYYINRCTNSESNCLETLVQDSMNSQDNCDGCIFNKINDVVEENTENGSFAGSNQDLITGIENTIFTRQCLE